MKAINVRKNVKRIICAAAVSCLGALFVVMPAAAQVELGLNYAAATGLGTTDIRTTIARIISIFLGLLGIIAVGLILYAGFLWMTAAGNEEKITKAKKTMVNATIGLVIILAAYAIVRFIFGAITGGEVGGPGDGGAGDGGGLGGVGTAFVVQSTMPAGPGPASQGWPKNYAITVTFNAAVSEASVTTSTFVVKRCNPRLDGDDQPQAFKLSDCGAPISGTRTVEGSRVIFRPDSTPVEEDADKPTYFEGDYWYYVEVKGGVSDLQMDTIRDTRDPARVLRCFTPPGVNIWDTTTAAASLCKRAVAFNDMVDITPPTVSIRLPYSPPGYCGSSLPVEAKATDDFLPAHVDFSLGFPVGESHDDGEINALQPAIQPTNSVDNLSFVNPFEIKNLLSIATATLVPGQSYILRAVANDPVPQTSNTAESPFKISPPECCAGECGPESPCGLCSCVPGGDPACTADNECTSNDDCASGACDLACRCPAGESACVPGKICTADSECAPGLCIGYCVEFPIIDLVTPPAAGPGSPVNIKGRFFGSTPGQVIFLGNIADPNDDRQAAPCAPGDWWYEEEPGVFVASVKVPDEAKDGPIKLITARGGDFWDDTTVTPPPRRTVNQGTEMNFLAEGQDLKPGICFVSPNKGPRSTQFKIIGTGFGVSPSGGGVSMGANDVNTPTWTEAEITGLVPPIQEGIYQMSVTVGDPTNQTTENDIKFTVTPTEGEETPKITEIVPSKGPSGLYITIFGSGFGTQKGIVRFISKVKPAIGSPDEAVGVEPDNPACSDFWHKTYIIIKVPSTLLTGGGVLPIGASEKVYEVVVRTQTGKESAPVDFTINKDPLRPGVCAINPPSGPPGTEVIISGGGFGSGPGTPRTATGVLPNIVYSWALPHNTVNFYKNDPVADTAFRPIGYSSWTDNRVSTWVPGDKNVKSTWPASGPVYVEAVNNWSSNSVPFKVQDCNEAGGDSACEPGTVCCSNGSCKADKAACLPATRTSAFGWLFSTEVLPEMPRVERCVLCTVEACPNTGGFQSPTPQGIDACRNAIIAASFNQVMDAGSFVGAVDIEECSDAAFNTCTLVTDKFTMAFTDGKQVRFTPIASYNPAYGKGHLTSGAWYQVTLKATADSGIKDTVPPMGRYLDGNYDRKAGGNFTFSFKVRDGDVDCEVTSVGVSPSLYNVDHKGEPKSPPPPVPGSGQPLQDPAGFAASPMGGNCNILSCDAGSYTVNWGLENNGSLGNEILNLHATTDICWEQVTANRETDPAQYVDLRAEVMPLGPNPALKVGTSQVSAKFVDPKVVAYAPKCKKACVDAMVYAVFNVAMEASTMTNNFKLYQCRNESCNLPYAATVATTARVDENVPADMEDRKFFVEVPGGKMLAGTSYRVELKGGADGIKSQSGVPLKGLNTPGEYFVWQFRTKDSDTPCTINRSVVQPSSATFQYIGQRLSLGVQAFGAPDECDAGGQQLNPYRYDWDWTIVTPATGTVQGFLPDPSLPSSRLDTKALSVEGCTDKCLNIGSQNRVPQCGNSVVDSPWEDCDKVGGSFPSWCDPGTCLFNGTAATCGDGAPNDGEACEKFGGTWPPGCLDPASGAGGCIFLGATEGNSTCGDGLVGDGEACDDGNTARGDGCSDDCLREGTLPSCSVVEEGEPCLNFCGNNITEKGEDEGCDVASGANAAAAIQAAGCDPVTCLKRGRTQCPPTVQGQPAPQDCCGNGILEDGEECDEFDVDGNRPSWCSETCLLRGSSYLYNPPSFCRDGSDPVQSLGEESRCESTDIPDDGKIDPFQVIQAGLPSSENISEGSSTDRVSAKVNGMTDETKIGKATVKLACTCDKQGVTEADHQNYCYQLGQAAQPALNLGCDKNGCCAPAPTIAARYPAGDAENICRNTTVRITFDQPMDPQTTQSYIRVYEQMNTCSGICSHDGFSRCQVDADCGAGSTCEPIKFCANKPDQTCMADIDCGEGDLAKCEARAAVQLAVGPATPPASAARPPLWKRIVDFFRDLFFGRASAAPPPDLATRLYCLVPGTISASGSVVTFYPKYSLSGEVWHRVVVNGANTDHPVVSKNGVPLKTTDNAYFKTGADICRIESVTVDPPSYLFSVAEDLGVSDPADTAGGDILDGDRQFTARAHPAAGGEEAEIGSTPDYSFKWNWALQPEDADPEKTSELIVTPRYMNPLFADNGFCEHAPVCVNNNTITCFSDAQCGGGSCGVWEFDNAGAFDCHVTPVSGTHVCGNLVCETGEDKNSCVQDCAVPARHQSSATVRVRQLPSPAFPRDGKRTVAVTADIYDRILGHDQKTAISDVTVMLCNTPWPRRRTCQEVKTYRGLPWDKNPTSPDWTATLVCSPNELVWYPFYDPSTNISFYYCRDGQQAGDAGSLLPLLNETQIVKLTFPNIPGQDILNEYLLTYTKTVGDENEPWYDDALGLRILKNPLHRGIKDWYKYKGFTGMPTSLEVDGYEALRDGRTTYVSAAAKSSTTLYTNIYTLTHTDGAAPETTAIYGQLLNNINMNMNMTREGYCMSGAGIQALDDQNKPVSCEHDRDCRIDNRPEICADEDCNSMIPNPDYDKVFLPERVAWTCKNEKGKIIRDMRRWVDVLSMRQTIASAATPGNYPRLEAGTFLRARTNSAWPSWDNVLSDDVGAALPTDPVNAYMECKAPGKNFDLATCWDSAKKVYQCPAGSHVYEYQSIGGTDFRILADFEVKNNNQCLQYPYPWTCSSLSNGACKNGGYCYLYSYSGATWVDCPYGTPMANCSQGYPRCYDYRSTYNYYCNLGYTVYCTYDDKIRCYTTVVNKCYDYSINQYTNTCPTPNSTAGCAPCTSNASMSWSGSNCIELPAGECTSENGCKETADGCQFDDGGILKIGGINQVDNNCKDEVVGEGGVCGDGLVQQSVGYNEECEPVSQPDIEACTASKYCSKLPSWSCAVDADCNPNPGDNNGPCINIPGGSRPGTRERACRDNCTWGNWGRCSVGFCGDGVKQSGEVCDDGDKASGGHNGDYGYCWTDCTKYGPRCGDGDKQPNEACDCKDLNGAYFLNGVVAPGLKYGYSPNPNCGTPTATNTPSCSWDCRAAGPRCGDGVINGGEVCDGGMQESKGYCSDSAKSPCNENKDCPAGSTCGNYCSTPEQRNQRYCGTNDPANSGDNTTACKWGTWKCTSPGQCGDGVKNTGEECDDGNDDNTDACVKSDFNQDGQNECHNAVCGDGFVQAGIEQCDEGLNNGVACSPEYGTPCNYCTSSCKLGTVSGAFCGDSKLQNIDSNPPGPEECDGDQLGMTDWICKSTATADQYLGRQTGVPHCNKTTCKRYCLDANSVPCKNTGSGDVATNFDRNRTNAANGDSLPLDYLTPATVTGWKDGYCNDPDKTPCNNTTVAPAACPAGQTCCPPGYSCTLTVTSGKTILADACDPDVDNDRVPNNMDCGSSDPNTYPRCTACSVNVAAAEACDDKDNDCNGLVDDSPPVDMVFALDVSGSMSGYITALANGINNFVNEFSGSQHKFGYVLFSQSSGNLIADPYSTGGTWRKCKTGTPPCVGTGFDVRVLPTDVATMQAKMQEFVNNIVLVGAIEPDYAVTYELASSNGGIFGIPWRSTAKPFIVVMTDEPASGSNATSVVAPTLGRAATETDVNNRLSSCIIGSCNGVAGAKVNFFTFNRSSYWGDWDGIIAAGEKSYRFIEISSSASTVTNDLRTKVFAEVCAPN